MFSGGNAPFPPRTMWGRHETARYENGQKPKVYATKSRHWHSRPGLFDLKGAGMKVVVAGGGIAGLATACACALRGHQVEVYEQAPELSEIGAGLQISPNGWRVLAALGVTEALEETLFEPPRIEMRLGRSGRRIWSQPIATLAHSHWHARYVHIHRADLVEALAARLQALAPGALRTGHMNAGYGSEARPALHFETGDPVQADVIVGADGLHSAIRRQMLGPGAPDYTGNMAWRAVVPVETLGADAPPANATIWAGQGRHAVTTRLRGGTLVNFVGLVERPKPSEEGWGIEGDRAEAQADFAGWAPPVVHILAQAERIHRWALFSRKPYTRWSEGPVVLLGDAAHPMLPSMAQGAVQALEDAWVLAACLDASTDPSAAGAAFYRERQARTARVQALSASNARMFHRAGRFGSPVYYGGMAVVTRLFPQILRMRQDWIYAHDVVKDWPL